MSQSRSSRLSLLFALSLIVVLASTLAAPGSIAPLRADHTPNPSSVTVAG